MQKRTEDRMAPDLYQDCDDYAVIKLDTREDWLMSREMHIAGSDASSFLDQNPYRDAHELWREKKGLVPHRELSSPAIEHGNALEPVLRYWFQQSYKDYDVQYRINTIFQSKAVDFMRYSPDGLLWHKERGKGILELKTTMIQNGSMLDEWKEQIPQHYYCQVLHGLLVLNFQYVILVAELRYAWNDRIEIRKYDFSREEVAEDLEWMLEEEKRRWQLYYIGNNEPPYVLKL